ncbi:MAG: tRNA (adenosine(37)-N6)-threonylcarbamoyltransferase complex transferase subunit TsaD [Patescibacteria group bacterium]
MKILSIETSCDETGITILNISGNEKNPVFEVIANSLASQIKIHAEYGGVYPALAKREHIKNLPILLGKTLKKVGLEKNKKPVNMIAVTSGPGLEPALWTGIVFAKELGKKWNVPVVPVNHMEGHILSVFAKKGKFKIPQIKFPALSLLVSGGHTELVLVKDWMKYKKIGETCDDAAGEAFDKVARMLSLSYPGGPQISKLAALGRKNLSKNEITLPRPMMYSKNYDFSFSGLKTAVLYLIQKIGKLDDKTKIAIATEFENAVVDVLTHKTIKAIKEHKIQTLIVAGGVAANTELKKILKKKIKENKLNTEILFPNKSLSTDNAIMIALVGYFRRKNKKTNIKADGGLSL